MFQLQNFCWDWAFGNLPKDAKMGISISKSLPPISHPVYQAVAKCKFSLHFLKVCHFATEKESENLRIVELGAEKAALLGCQLRCNHSMEICSIWKYGATSADTETPRMRCFLPLRATWGNFLVYLLFVFGVSSWGKFLVYLLFVLLKDSVCFLYQFDLSKSYNKVSFLITSCRQDTNTW